ncbi:MAG TPA: hypothetical protein DCQ30_02095 [Acidimicrobiaceae bacterium]|nr:hypothetical protein [Acidimicrobiaceae bacterium]
MERLLHDVWTRIPEILAEEDLSSVPTIGNRNNVFLAAITIASYQTLLGLGLEGTYARELCSDVGWTL